MSYSYSLSVSGINGGEKPPQLSFLHVHSSELSMDLIAHYSELSTFGQVAAPDEHARETEK